MQAETFTLERTFNAPRELVYKAWTNLEHLAQWWGPKGFELQVKKLDPQPGGIFHYAVISPAGDEIWAKFIFRELVPPERLVFISFFSDASGNMGSHPWAPGLPKEFLNVITLAEEAGKTRLTITITPYNATAAQSDSFAESRPSMQAGFNGTFDKLDDLLIKLT
ncbi:MAG: activator of Hsp90 ATPase 1 family protein [Flavipsychrobacter sp.]|jgi:uncharacterized protein YndB with AHSA1/START domain|nr:activator of Hsp90 ATPase 1 family protein [Flavipsychrobacter sp.]